MTEAAIRAAATLAGIAALAAIATSAAGAHAGPGVWDRTADVARLPVTHDHGDDWDPAVAVDGDLAAVGDADGNEVWLFRRDGARWRAAGHLPPDGSHGPDAFGAAVDVDDGRILVGTPGADVSSPDGSYGGTNAGSAYLYVHDDGDGWTLQHRFLGEPAARTEDYLGRGVALSADVAAVGAPSIVTGDVHVFRQGEDGAWRQEARLTGKIFDGLGTGLDLNTDGTLVVAGAPGIRGALSWERASGDPGAWEPAGELPVPDDADADWPGWDVAVTGNATALGARSGGEAWVFQRADAGWSVDRAFTGPPEASDAFGRSVAAHGDHVAVGDPGNGSGAVAIHVRGDDGAWRRSTTATPDGASPGDAVGVDAALTADTLVAGSRDAGSPGAVHAPSAFAVAPDRDGDGLSDWREDGLGTNPRNPDTDGDGLEDGPELRDHGIDPLDPDTDGDLHMDSTELRRGSDPADPASVPLPGGRTTPSTGPTGGQEVPVADELGPVR